MAKQQKTTPKQDWQNIEGTMVVWGKNFKSGKKTWTKFSTSLARKFDSEKDYTNYYIDIQFTAEAPEGEGKHTIDIKKGFLSFDKYEDKNGAEVTRLKIVVMEYEEFDD